MSVATQASASPAKPPRAQGSSPAWGVPTAAALLLVAAVFVACWPSHAGQFLSWHDQTNVAGNALVRQQMQSAIWSSADRGQYRPVALGYWTTLASPAPAATPEDELAPAPYRWGNIVLAALAAVVVFALLTWLTGNVVASCAGAMLWALHPWSILAAGWISQGPQLLGAVLGLGALWVFFQRPATPPPFSDVTRRALVLRRLGWYSAASLLFLAGLLTAPLTIIVPLLGLCLLYGWLQRRPRQDLESALDWAILLVWFLVGATLLVQFEVRLQQAPQAPAGSITALLNENRLELGLLAAVLIAGGLLVGGRRAATATAMALLPLAAVLISLLAPATIGAPIAVLALLGPALLLAACLTAHGSRTAYAAIALLLGGLLVAGHVRAYDWLDDANLAAGLARRGSQPALAETLLGYAALREDDRAAAARHFDAAVTAEPRFAPARTARAELRLAAGQFSDAEADLRAALDQFPLDPTANLTLARALIARGDGTGAIAALRRAQEFDPHNAALYLELGQALLLNVDIQGAVASFERSLELQPGQSAAWLGLAQANARFPDQDRDAIYRSIEAAQRVLELDPLQAVARQLVIAGHRRISDQYVAEGQLASAEQELNALLQFAPGEIDARTALGNLLIQGQRFDEAAAQFEQALLAAPQDSEARFGLGTVHYLQGRNDEAIACFREVLATQPDHAGSLYQLGMVLSSRGEMGEALDLFRAALAQRATFKLWPLAANNLAWILATCEDPAFRNGAEAVEWAKQVFDFYLPQQPADFLEYVDTLSAAYAEAGRWPEAIDMARRALVMAEQTGNEEARARFRRRLEMYLTNRPIREPLVVVEPSHPEPLADPIQPAPELDLSPVELPPDVPIEETPR